MKSTGKKNLVIIVEQDSKSKQLSMSRFSKFTPTSSNKILKTESQIDGYKTPMNRVNFSHADINTPISRKYTSNVSRNQSLHDLSQSGSNMRGNNEQEKSVSIRSQSKRKLVFVQKKKKFVQGETAQDRFEARLRDVMDSIRGFLRGLEAIVKEIQSRIKTITDQMSKKFEKEAMVFVSNFIKKTEQTQKQSARVEVKADKIAQIPVLDLSKIGKFDKSEKEVAVEPKRFRRQAKTDRNMQKDIDFDAPSRTSRKFQAFNQTLHRIKRLSFGGSILKL